MQSFLARGRRARYEDFRLQLEVGYASDRNFLEEYYKRLFDTGLDQETLAYLIRQKENRAWTVWTEANLQNWYTDTQWLPRLDYYRLGDSLLGNWFTYFQHSGVDYANTHTAVEVNNPNIFAFMPYDPISNTSRDVPARAGSTPTTSSTCRSSSATSSGSCPTCRARPSAGPTRSAASRSAASGAPSGARAEHHGLEGTTRGVESELFNVHGLNHKINFDVDCRDA